MLNLRMGAAAAALGLAPFPALAQDDAATPEPPRAEQRPVELEAHGDVRIDEYYWLRGREDADVIAYLEAENDYMRTIFEPYEALEEHLFEEMTDRLSDVRELAPWEDDGYLYGQRYAEGEDYAVYWRRPVDDPEAEEDILVDGPALAEGTDYWRLGEYAVSPNGRYLATTTDDVGRRIYTLRIQDRETGEYLPDEITGIEPDFVWAGDSDVIYYLRKDEETLRPYQLYRHRLGSEVSEDELVYQEDDDRFLLFLGETSSEEYVSLGSYYSTSLEYRFYDITDGEAAGEVFAERREDHEYYVDHAAGAFYVLTNNEAVNFRLMRADAPGQPMSEWTDVVGPREDVLLENFAVFDEFLVLQERADANSQVRVMRHDGSDDHIVEVGEEAYTAAISGVAGDVVNPDVSASVLRFGYTSMTTPQTIYAYDMGERALTELRQEVIEGGFDSANYATARLTAPARDGAEVPVTLAWREDLRADGPQPLLLIGYGSYGYSYDPQFSSWLVSLYDRGFIVAIAHIRGGQERGRPWYDDGKLLNKMNTFTDFIDVGEFLIAEGYVTADQLFARGGSAGGLLMGAVMNMRPDLFAGVVARVPFVDVVTTMLDDTIPLTTYEYDEWGNPNEQEYYEYMLSYSPYDQVSAQDYPDLYVTAGLHDSQVQYWEPAKWVARLRDRATGDGLILLETNMEAGHGGASGRLRSFGERAREVVFLLHVLGTAEAEAEAAAAAASVEDAEDAASTESAEEE